MTKQGLRRIAERWPDSVGHKAGGVAAVMEALGCDLDAGIRVALCRAPRPGEDLAEWAGQVSEYAGVDRERLQRLAEHIVKESKAKGE